MQIALLVQFLQTYDDLWQNFRSFFYTEDFSWKFRLIVNEISTITVLKNQINIGFIFFDIVESCDVGRVHGLHAFDFTVEILSEMRFSFYHFYGDEFECKLSSFLILDKIDVTVGSLSESLLIFVLIQKHELIKILLWLSIKFSFNKITCSW